MASPTRHNTVVPTGKAMAAQSHANRRSGPGNKNLGPSRNAQANPKGTVRAIAGKSIRGPDLGGGGG